jgi:hypothetical protein
MKKSPQTLFSLLFLAAVTAWLFYSMMPRWISPDDAPLSEFSTKRAMAHVAELSKTPHYVGSEAHEQAAQYLIGELKKLGLEVTVQEGTSLSGWGNLARSRNILARIKGSQGGKALVMLSHYDSAPHSKSRGASDDGAGVAAVLETLRAFLHNATPHKNDIIVLFTDAEELGLNGAALFVTQHPWAKETGLVLNCEARGTSGPSYMLMEANGGNAAMVDGFSQAKVRFPLANSLMYSIYKMLPNDTDLTVFRENGNIPGFNFAFIDSHFNYHTAQDDAAHLDLGSLRHQGAYLMPMLQYFSNANLSALHSDQDEVYFSTPVGFFSYPFSYNYSILGVVALLLVLTVFIGMGKRTLPPSAIGKGFINLLAAVALCGAVGFFGWKLMLSIYPQYSDILQGFTYNGHAYIAGFTALAIGICFLIYSRPQTDAGVMSQTIAPMTLWLLANLAVVIYVPGGAFLIWPLLATFLMFAWFVASQKSSAVLNAILGVFAIFLIVPFIWMFPIGLGLKIIFGSMILTALTFGLLLPVFGSMPGKPVWAAASFVIAIGFFIYAHADSGYAPGKAKPNSLVYLIDADKGKAWWATYDTNPDNWTRTYLGDHPQNGDAVNGEKLFSKYNSAFTFCNGAPVEDLPVPTIEFLRDTVLGDFRYLRIRITPNRKVNRYDIFADEKIAFYNLRANGAASLDQKSAIFPRKDRKILGDYVVNNEPLLLEFAVKKNALLDMTLIESSFDLLENPVFDVKKRSPDMMPAPFVLNDAVIIREKIKPSPKPVAAQIARPVVSAPVPQPVALDTLQTPDDQ